MRREQRIRCSEAEERADDYAPMAQRFSQDPFRTDEPALDVLLDLARPRDTWLDIGAGGGRYTLPLALKVWRVEAVEPSPAMLTVLRDGMQRHGIHNVNIYDGEWPMEADAAPDVDVALMAHVGYEVEDLGAFLDAAEAAASRRCVAIMRQGSATTPGHLLWPEIHGEPREAPPMLPELVALLLARGARPSVTLVERSTWGYPTRTELLEASYRQLWLRAGSPKAQRLEALVSERAREQDGMWALDWSPMRDGVVVWSPGGGNAAKVS